MLELGRILDEFKKKGGQVLMEIPEVQKKVSCPLNSSCKKINTERCDMGCLKLYTQIARVIED